MAAHRFGITTIILPRINEKGLDSKFRKKCAK